MKRVFRAQVGTFVLLYSKPNPLSSGRSCWVPTGSVVVALDSAEIVVDLTWTPVLLDGHVAWYWGRLDYGLSDFWPVDPWDVDDGC